MVKWRALLGLIITCFIAIPYVMGADVEKYLRTWIESTNQKKGQVQLELQNYQRHWFSSEGDLLITSLPLKKKWTLHFIADHGPLLIHGDPRQHFGLSSVRGKLESTELFDQQSVVHLSGPLLFSAYIPYFSDRELHGRLQEVSIQDKGNNLVYQLSSVEACLDDDVLLQLEIPTLTVSRPDGSEKLKLNAGLLRIQLDNGLASFTASKIRIPLKESGDLTIQNFMLNANTEVPPSQDQQFILTVNTHFEQLKILAISTGPMDFRLKLSGLKREGLSSLLSILKTLNPQKADLTPEQNDALEKGVSNLFAENALFDLDGNLSIAQGQIKAQFRGGFKAERAKSPWHNTTELIDAFYSKGNIQMSAEIKQLLTLASLHPSSDQVSLALPLLLHSLKPKGPDVYSANIDIRDGTLFLYGKN